MSTLVNGDRLGTSIAAAAWGACLGWLLACGVVLIAKTGILPVPSFLGSADSVKGLEKVFYLCFYVLGAVFAFVSASYARSLFRNVTAAAIGVLLFVLFAAQLTGVVVNGGPLAFWPALPPLDPRAWPAFSAQVVPLTYWLAVPPLALGGAVLVGRMMGSSVATTGEPVARPEPSGFSRRDALWLGGCAVLLAACLFPLDVETVTARIGYNPHPVSFYIAPALFLLRRGLIPGVDFFPQYGIGIGYLFSFFLRPTAGATMANVVLVTATLSCLYFASALWVLRRLYDSRVYAFVVVFVALLLNFHTAITPRGIMLDPSAWPARYPFLFLLIWLFARAVDSRQQVIDLGLAGMAAGLCLFWNTETGLYAIASALLATLLLGGGARIALRNLLATAVGAVVAFFLLATVAYGPGVFQSAFISGLFKPMTVYAAGLGAIPVVWQSPLNILYAVLSPVVGFATMGWSAANMVRPTTDYSKRTLSVLFLLSTLGICLMLKWVNMSLDALWHVNALPILAVMAWWIRAGLQHLSMRSPAVHSRRNVAIIQWSVLAVVLVFLGFVQDARNPSTYALRAFLIFPNVFVETLKPVPPEKWNKAGEAANADTALIQRCTNPNERVTLVDDYDWVYLLAARRTPEMSWLPSTTIGAFPFLIDEALRSDGPIFIPGNIDRLKFAEPLDTALRTRLHSDYQPGPVGTALEVYRYKRPATDATTDRDC